MTILKYCSVLLGMLGFSMAVFAQDTTRVPSQDTIEFSYADLPFSESVLLALQQYEDTIDVLTNHVLHDTSEIVRMNACKFVIKTLVKALKTPKSFEYPFPQIERISIQYPQDSSFRIFTWQLFVGKDDYRYYGAIQLNTEELKLIPLVDRSYKIENPKHQVLNNRNWYGALYYNIHQFDTPEGRKYLLFGYDANSFFHKRKVMDILQISGQTATFGAPIFVIPPDILEEQKRLEKMQPKYAGNRMTDRRPVVVPEGEPQIVSRFILNYSAETTVRLNYDSQYKLILFDNLITVPGNYRGQGQMNVPDGSIRGFELKPDGRWKQIEKVFNDSQDEAPRPKPIERDDTIPKNR